MKNYEVLLKEVAEMIEYKKLFEFKGYFKSSPNDIYCKYVLAYDKWEAIKRLEKEFENSEHFTWFDSKVIVTGENIMIAGELDDIKKRIDHNDFM